MLLIQQKIRIKKIQFGDNSHIVYLKVSEIMWAKFCNITFISCVLKTVYPREYLFKQLFVPLFQIEKRVLVSVLKFPWL